MDHFLLTGNSSDVKGIKEFRLRSKILQCKILRHCESSFGKTPVYFLNLCGTQKSSLVYQETQTSNSPSSYSYSCICIFQKLSVFWGHLDLKVFVLKTWSAFTLNYLYHTWGPSNGAFPWIHAETWLNEPHCGWFEELGQSEVLPDIPGQASASV